jgi:kojibiose phosphorylase
MLKTVSPADWVVEEAAWQPDRNAVWESLFTVANGYLGVRGFPEEPFDAGPTCPAIYLAGVFNPGDDGIPELVTAANVLAVEIELGGRPLRMAPPRLGEYRRTLDLKRGLLQRSMVYTDEGRTTRIEFERFASIARPHLLGQSIILTPLNWTGEATVRLWTDGPDGDVHPPGRDARAAGKEHRRLLHAQHMGRDRLLLAAETADTKVRIAHACRCRAWVRQAAPPKPVHVRDTHRLGFAYRVRLECGQRAIFDRLVATYTSRDPEATSVERACLEEVQGAEGAAYGVRRRHTIARWRRRWNHADVLVEGPAEDQRAVRFAIFHLLQSCPPADPRVSIAAKGLTGPGYRGHVFWDTEIFMLPLFVRVDPGAARRLLEYRRHTVPGARRKARAAGYRGAMFPWESADTGDEACPPVVPDPKTGRPVPVLTGRLQHHVTADVAYAAWQYVRATGDVRFREQVLLVLAVLTARFWASRVAFNRDRRRYEIRGVIGPDEYHESVDNNAFTNYLAAWNLRLADREVRRMQAVHRRSLLLGRLAVSDRERRRWRAIARRMFVPVKGGMVEQFDGFFALRDADVRALSSRASNDPEKVRMKKVRAAQVLKQADVLMLMVLFPEAFAPDVKRRSWDYYEPRTTHDSSLSPSVHSIAASDLGLADRAYEYFRLSAVTDLEDTMGNTDSGLHLAALGGTYQAVVRGFLGLRTGRDGPSVESRLPPAWNKVVARIHHRRQWYLIEATRGGATAKPVPP